jgi:hypothetical protein
MPPKTYTRLLKCQHLGIMEVARQIPVSLKIVAAIFILSGVSSAIGVVLSLLKGSLNLDFGVLGIFIGLGLLRLQPLWHTIALLFTGLALIAIPVFTLISILGSEPVSLRVFGQEVGYSSRTVVLILAALYFALEVWKMRVLTCRDVTELFGG